MTQASRAAWLPIALVPALLSSGLVHAKPKYGPDAVPLSRKTNLEYFQKTPAADFWALMPYYLPQPTPRACGATTLALVLNGARSSMPLQSDEPLVTVESFVKKYADKPYEDAIYGAGLSFDRANVTNKNMARLLELAAGKLKLKTAATRVERVDVDAKDLEGSKRRFVEDLKRNEKSADDFMLISFIQGTLTGDPEGGAHVAAIGGYDAKKGLVLVMDPDREWYEPYWSPVGKVFDAVKDPRADGVSPGWIRFQVR